MTTETRKRFESVTIRDAWGRFDANGFHLDDDVHAGLHGGITFSTCSISQEIAVVFDQKLATTARADLASRKPDWLDVIVHAEIASTGDAKLAVIDAEIISPVDADTTECAFAIACVGFDLGQFEVEPERYLVRFGQQEVHVRMDFDYDSESWFGEAEQQIEVD